MAEIHRLLKLEEPKTPGVLPVPEPDVKPEEKRAKTDPTPRTTEGAAPLNLPAIESLNVPFHTAKDEVMVMPKLQPNEKTSRPSPGSVTNMEALLRDEPAQNKPGRLKNLIVYPVIFAVAFVGFYALLNLPSLASQVKAWFIKPQDEQILQEDLTEYNGWISGYFFSVGNRELLGANNDIDHDGLTNYEEFVLGTNPTLVDSAGNGLSDGVKVIDGLNYWGSGPMTDSQKERVKKLDLNLINNRISYNSAVTHGSTAVEHKVAFDRNREGKLSIPRLNLQVPLVWSDDPSDFETDLSRGVIHYPGTAMPGEQGTMYVSGHSSDYLWKRNEYKRVFAQLNALEPGDDIFIEAYGLDGKVYNHRYTVTAEHVYKPDDQTQFIDNSTAKLNLSTCWPIGTAKDRYVVSAILKPL